MWENHGKPPCVENFSYGNHGFSTSISTSMLICPGALEYLLTMAMFNGYISLLGGRNASVSCAQVSNLWGKWRGAKRDQHVRINRTNTFLFVIVGRYRDIFGFNLGSIWVIDFLGAQVRPVLLSVFCLEIDLFFFFLTYALTFGW